MNEIKCPECNEHAELVKNAEKLGTLIGCSIGLLAAFADLPYKDILNSKIPVIKPGPWNNTKEIAGIITGAVVGNKVGEAIDKHFLRCYRCRKCQTEFSF